MVCRHVTGRKKGTNLKTHGIPFMHGMAKKTFSRGEWLQTLHRAYITQAGLMNKRPPADQGHSVFGGVVDSRLPQSDKAF
jgi:hypothetical protein